MEIKSSIKKSGFSPYAVNGFVIRNPLTTNNAGNCTWGYAEKYGRQFFIKQFLNPKFPKPDADMYESTRARMVEQCEKWYSAHSRVYKAILECGGSNIVNPLDFFNYENTYYLVTEKISSCGVSFMDIYKRSDEQKQLILKILAYEISRLAEKNVIHSDLKPDNLILKETVDGFFTVKIIDFDASFLENEPPEPDDLTGDQVYFSPEMILYMNEEEVTVTPKSDVFALGVLFHIILCGKLPGCGEVYDCLGHAVLNGDKPQISGDIDKGLREIIGDMLCAAPEKRPDAFEVFRRLGGKTPETSVCSTVKTSSEKSDLRVTQSGLVINMKKSNGDK